MDTQTDLSHLLSFLFFPSKEHGHATCWSQEGGISITVQVTSANVGNGRRQTQTNKTNKKKLKAQATRRIAGQGVAPLGRTDGIIM